MPAPLLTARRLAAARDIAAVLVFCGLVLLGGRAVLEAPFFQKERLTSAEAAGDIDRFYSELETYRPGGLTAAERARYDAARSSAAAQAAAARDEFGRITMRDLAWTLCLAAASTGDESTAVLWRPQRKWKDPAQKFPPFTLALRSGRLTVDRSLDPALRGAELLELGGKPAETFLAPVLQRIPGATAPYRAYMFCRAQDVWWDFSGLLEGAPGVGARFRTADGRQLARNTPPITGGEFRRLGWTAPLQGGRLYAHRQAGWLAPDGLADSRAWRRRTRAFFGTLENGGITLLVIDLRDAPAGNMRAAQELLRLTGGWLKQGGRRAALLTGPGSGSAAAAFAQGFRDMKAGEILGEPTGGTPGHPGAPRTLRLPASGIYFTVPTRSYPGSGLPVVPDVALHGPPPGYRGDLASYVLELLAQSKAR